MKRTPANILAWQRIMQCIDEVKSSDSRLPSERILCEMADVSLGTLHKVIKQLASEGIIHSAPRKGNFISKTYQRTNIGIVIGVGTKPTFIAFPEMLCGILSALEELNCWARLISLSDDSQVEKFAMSYAFDGLIWYHPNPSQIQIASSILKKGKIPIAIAASFGYSDSLAKLSGNYATIDYAAVGRIRADHLLKRGHKSIAYVGRSDTPSYEAFRSALKSSRIAHAPEFAFASIEDVAARLPTLLKVENITALAADSGLRQLKATLSVLNKHPKGKGIDVLIDYVPELRSMLEECPNVSLSSVLLPPYHKIGKAAASALVASARGGPRQFPPLFVSPQIESYDGRQVAQAG